MSVQIYINGTCLNNNQAEVLQAAAEFLFSVQGRGECEFSVATNPDTCPGQKAGYLRLAEILKLMHSPSKSAETIEFLNGEAKFIGDDKEYPSIYVPVTRAKPNGTKAIG